MKKSFFVVFTFYEAQFTPQLVNISTAHVRIVRSSLWQTFQLSSFPKLKRFIQSRKSVRWRIARIVRGPIHAIVLLLFVKHVQIVHAVAYVIVHL